MKHFPILMLNVVKGGGCFMKKVNFSGICYAFIHGTGTFKITKICNQNWGKKKIYLCSLCIFNLSANQFL